MIRRIIGLLDCFYNKGRFASIDPLWEKYYSWTPYHYSLNNPVSFLDSDGKQTKKELSTSFKFPGQAIKIHQNAQVALDKAVELFGSNGIHNGKGDAFRHALWNAMNTRDVGFIIAKEFADAHEDDKENPVSEKNMDLINNARGRQIARENPNATDDDFIKILLEYINEDNGKLQLSPTEVNFENSNSNQYYQGNDDEN